MAATKKQLAVVQAAIVCHDDATYLKPVLASLAPIPATVFISRTAWGGESAGDWQLAASIAENSGASVIIGEWKTEQDQRNFVLDWAIDERIEALLIPDSDEVLSQDLLNTLVKIAEADLSDCVHCTMDTYWKSPEYVIRPRERLMPPIMIRPRTVSYTQIREFRGQRPLMISEEHGVLHHLSYCGPNSRIARKIATWSHKDEVVPSWWTESWEGWNEDRTKQGLHPTHPGAYGYTNRIAVPSELGEAWESYLAASGGTDPLHLPIADSIEDLPTLSVVIPLYGGVEDLRKCLGSLAKCRDLLFEVIVVDDASPDSAPEVVSEFDFCTLLQNPENLGFAATCNAGAAHSSGHVLLFLNSDTIVPRVAIVEMMKALGKSGTIGAVGPVSNAIGHYQQIFATYHSEPEIDLFGDDLARCARDDFECDMLVGFCLAIRRSAWEEVGPFDEQFRVGMFEDNDLCYRLCRAGYRLVVAPKAFVHHRGHASLDRSGHDKRALFEENRSLYFKKWEKDLSSGFVNNLAGIQVEPIKFDESRRPERMQAEVEALAKTANVSLCMIVRNEERVLGDCLKSAKAFFSEIVIVDTGSSDRTIEIAKEHGAKVFDIAWPESFAGARNESLKHATGDWICWLDADDTLPLVSGYALLKAVIAAPDDLGGLVMPIRFVNDDPEFGTSVDHVKVFRNHRNWQFEGRIHEQILQDIRQDGFILARLNAEVLHTGYDTSEEGQERKRQRDEHLLLLDLQDRPGHPFVLFNLGMTAHYLQKHAEAIDWLKQSVLASQPSDSHVRKAYAMWAVSAAQLEGSAVGLRIVEDGLAVASDDPELLFRRGVFCSELELYEAAALAYERVLQVGRGMHFGSMDTGIFGYKTLHNLGGTYVRLGNYGRARESFLNAMRSNPRFPDSAFAFFPLAMQNRDREACELILRHLDAVRGFPRDVLEQMFADFRAQY